MQPHFAIHANRVQSIGHSAGALLFVLADDEDVERIRAELQSSRVRLGFADRLRLERRG